MRRHVNGFFFLFFFLFFVFFHLFWFVQKITYIDAWVVFLLFFHFLQIIKRCIPSIIDLATIRDKITYLYSFTGFRISLQTMHNASTC